MRENYTVDNNTRASNPGNTILKPLIWFNHNQVSVILISSLLLLAIFFTAIVSFWNIILILVALIINIFYWLRKNEHFKSGDSNGGVVISTKPNLIAVTTDLRKFSGNFPVVKIIK